MHRTAWHIWIPPLVTRLLLPLVLLQANVSFATSPLPILRLSGEAPREWFGVSVASLGDVNGDGFRDLIVGTKPIPLGPHRAAAFVYFGGPSADSIPALVLTPEPGATFSELFGTFVASAGDLNRDGYSDFAVGSPLEREPDGGSFAGRVYLYYGGAAMDGHAGAILSGDRSNELFGWSIASAGDLNGDGYDDLIVGAPQWHDFNDVAGKGRAFIYFGGPNPHLEPDLVLDTPLPPGAEDGDFGYSVSSAGDVNGDGYPDVVVAQAMVPVSPCCFGRAFIFYGGPEMDGRPDRVLKMNFGWGGSSSTVSSAGDFNGDGLGDVVVSAPTLPPTGGVGFFGHAYVYSRQGRVEADSVPSLVLTGEPGENQFAFSISGGRDVNGDGYPDIIVGAPGANPDGHRRGRIYVFFGGANPDSVPDMILDGEVDGSQFGYSVSSGDVNGDGVADVIVGAPGVGLPSSSDPGHVYVYDLSTPLHALAFVRGGDRTIPLVDAPSQTCVRFEPVNGSYDNATVDLSTIRLVSAGTGTVSEIPPVESKRVIMGDTDGNGIAELSACFARSDLARLFSSIRGRRTVDAAIEGRLTNARKFRAPLSLTVVGTGKPDRVTASVSPNPLNPRGTLKFATSMPGAVTARLYDLSGRLVRSIAQSQRFEPGEHSLVIDGRDDRGATLATGVYFYRIETPDGTSQGRFVVAK